MSTIDERVPRSPKVTRASLRAARVDERPLAECAGTRGTSIAPDADNVTGGLGRDWRVDNVIWLATFRAIGDEFERRR
jgi:hypothetical protein